MSERYPCPCCGYLMFDEEPGSHDICEICFWEDDPVRLRWPDSAGGANGPSLIAAQLNFRTLVACEARVLPYVRPATSDDARDALWRPVAVRGTQVIECCWSAPVHARADQQRFRRTRVGG
jgi:Cysteine-rich CPCC